MNRPTRPWPPAWLFSLPLCLLLTNCREDVVGCTDPDATNFDVTADASCDDCCNYPRLNLNVLPRWGTETLGSDAVRQDGAGNDFVLERFRVYLGGLALETDNAIVTEPQKIEELGVDAGAGQTVREINVNAVLLSSSGGTLRAGTLAIGPRDPTALIGTYGLPEAFIPVVPASAPSGSILRPQPGLLNFNDGRGYVRGKLDYRFPGDTTPLSLAFYGEAPFVLPIDTVVTRNRFDNLTLELTADFSVLFGGVDLRGDSAVAAAALGRDWDGFLRISGVE